MEGHLFLGSQGLGAFDAWLSELPERPRRAVTVHADDDVRSYLDRIGLETSDLDPAGTTPATADAALAAGGVAVVCGGYPGPLLSVLIETGLASALTRAVREGAIAYAGLSAGASLAAPDLSWVGDGVRLRALNLVPFYPLVHANRGRRDHYAQIMLAHGDRHRFVPIRDDQAITVHGTDWLRRPSAIC